jgi:hypothetical protein
MDLMPNARENNSWACTRFLITIDWQVFESSVLTPTTLTRELPSKKQRFKLYSESGNTVIKQHQDTVSRLRGERQGSSNRSNSDSLDLTRPV